MTESECSLCSPEYIIMQSMLHAMQCMHPAPPKALRRHLPEAPSGHLAGRWLENAYTGVCLVPCHVFLISQSYENGPHCRVAPLAPHPPPQTPYTGHRGFLATKVRYFGVKSTNVYLVQMGTKPLLKWPTAPRGRPKRLNQTFPPRSETFLQIKVFAPRGRRAD